MADFNKPDNNTLKVSVLQEQENRATDIATMAKPTANIPTGYIHWNNTNVAFERYNGATWDVLNITPSAADVLALLITVDGAGSGVDADLLDGQEGAYYLAASSYTAADVLTKLLTVDGAGSGLDADLLDGVQGTGFARLGTTNPTVDYLYTTRNDAVNSAMYVNQQGAGGDIARFFKGTSTATSGADQVTIDNNAKVTATGGFATPLNTLSDVTSLRVTNTSGYIEIGPKNTSYCHIYTGNPSFYFNKELKVLGSDVYHTGNSSTLLKTTGDQSISGNKEFYSTYTSGVYSSAAIELREVNLVTTTQSSATYAPAIGFHWGGRVQKKMYLDYLGELYISGAATGGGKIWHSDNDGSGSGLDADLLDGVGASSTNTVNTIAKRNGSGDVVCRLIRTEYTGTNTTGAYYVVMNATGTGDNYHRPISKANVRKDLLAGLALGAVGSYASLKGQTAAQGVTKAGSGLSYAGSGGSTPSSPAGTWRCMGYSSNTSAVTTWLRIS